MAKKIKEEILDELDTELLLEDVDFETEDFVPEDDESVEISIAPTTHDVDEAIEEE